MRIVKYITSDEDENILGKVIKHGCKEFEVVDYWRDHLPDKRVIHHFLVDSTFSQPLIDLLQPLVHKAKKSRIIVSSIEAMVPSTAAIYTDDVKEKIAQSKKGNASGIGRISREELYQDVKDGAQLDKNYLLMIFFSTIVAAVGLITNDVAVIVGSMVIAPFLGPNLALSLATVLGDKSLTRQAILTGTVGIGLGLLMSVLLGIVWPYVLESEELMRRTEVGFGSIILALSAGAAAVLSLTKGTASALVGVMVAAALLPPLVSCGLMLGVGEYYKAEGAAVLFAVNIACINIAANIVLMLHGITPQNWFERSRARTGLYVSCSIWAIGLIFLSFVIFTRQEYFSNLWPW